MSTNFYLDLPSFTNFSEFTDDSHFLPLPSDWYVLITDIRGSTSAIAEGRYKEVNTVGAATIVVAKKGMLNIDFPFVFGGDGATLLVPKNRVKAVCENLAGLRILAKKNNSLDLRIGIVPMQELMDSGKKVLVGKFEITPGKSIAILKGEGITEAEKLIKGSDRYEFKTSENHTPDLTGLSCRWNPIPSRKGRILTLLIMSRKDSKIYEEFLKELTNIIPEGIESSNPTNVGLASYKSISKIIKDELKLHKNIFSPSLLLRIIEIVAAVLIFKYKIPPIFFNPSKYAQSMRTHSDFRKFDDVLRMVIDCSPTEISKIKEYLESKYKMEQLYFGTFESDQSLMTCFVDGLGQGQHIHFIDAENGGYAMAAVELKKQIKKGPSTMAPYPLT